jgi:hypothetical protein
LRSLSISLPPAPAPILPNQLQPLRTLTLIRIAEDEYQRIDCAGLSLLHPAIEKTIWGQVCILTDERHGENTETMSRRMAGIWFIWLLWLVWFVFFREQNKLEQLNKQEQPASSLALLHRPYLIHSSQQSSPGNKRVLARLGLGE